MVKRTLINFVKLLIVAGIFFYLFKYGGFDISELKKAFVHYDLLTYSFIFSFIGLAVTSERWRYILRVQGVHLGVWQAFKLTFVGFFFSIALPGSVSGDIIKAYYITKGKERKAVLITSVVFDRLIGVYSMLFLTALTMGYVFIKEYFSGNASVWSTSYFRTLGILLIVLFVIVTGIGMLFVSTSLRKIDFLRKIVYSLPFHEKILSVYRIIHEYGRKPGPVIVTIIISSLAQIPGYIGIWFISMILGINVFTFVDLMIVLPICFFFNSIPIAPAGLGIGEVGFGKIFQLFGSNDGAEVAFIMHAVLISISVVIGGLIYILSDLSKTSANIILKENQNSK